MGRINGDRGPRKTNLATDVSFKVFCISINLREGTFDPYVGSRQQHLTLPVQPPASKKRREKGVKSQRQVIRA